MKKVLVVEDEASIRSFISLNVKRAGYQVLEASSGEEAIDVLKYQSPVFALIDIMLPGMDGFELCKHIKILSPSTGIIALTAKSQEEDKIKGLQQGADDYLTKPFSPKELIARMEAILRRLPSIQVEQLLHSGPFILDITKQRLLSDGRQISLTPTEFGILKCLIVHSPNPLSRDEILDKVWGDHYIGDIKVVDVNIRRLRKKIEPTPSSPAYIQTYWGTGYVWIGEQG